MDRHFDEGLAALKHKLVKMGALTELMIGDAIKVLMDRHPAAIPAVYQHEDQVNHLQVEIDEQCVNLIALHQPVAQDLRFIMGIAKTNCDLERLADQAVNICQKADRLLGEPSLEPYPVIPQMVVIAKEMLKDSLHSFVTSDVPKARAVLTRDDELDALNVKVTDELVDMMKKDPSSISRALTIMLISRNLERIGDHATNIAENTIFVVQGRDVRHHMEPT